MVRNYRTPESLILPVKSWIEGFDLNMYVHPFLGFLLVLKTSKS